MVRGGIQKTRCCERNRPVGPEGPQSRLAAGQAFDGGVTGHRPCDSHSQLCSSMQTVEVPQLYMKCSPFTESTVPSPFLIHVLTTYTAL